MLGHIAGASYSTLEAKAGKYVAIGLAVIVIAILVVWRVRRERRELDD